MKIRLPHNSQIRPTEISQWFDKKLFPQYSIHCNFPVYHLARLLINKAKNKMFRWNIYWKHEAQTRETIQYLHAIVNPKSHHLQMSDTIYGIKNRIILWNERRKKPPSAIPFDNEKCAALKTSAKHKILSSRSFLGVRLYSSKK